MKRTIWAGAVWGVGTGIALNVATYPWERSIWQTMVALLIAAVTMVASNVIAGLR